MSDRKAGEQIGGRYRLEQRLGCGGMGEVWLAELHGAGAFRRRVVVKLLAPERRGDQRLASMLADEARVVGLLHHPGIVPAIDYLETEEHGPVFVLEYVDGPSLRAVLKVLRRHERQMPEHIAAYIGAKVARALHAAHTAPVAIIHRDVAPDNVLLSRDGVVWLGDFGVALASDTSQPVEQAGLQVAWKVSNQSGGPKGKRAYMAPEQARGGPVGPAADLYALGKVLFECTKPGAKLCKVLERACAEDPAGRQSSGADLAAELLVACPPPIEPQAALAQWLLENVPEAMVSRAGPHGAARRSDPPPAGKPLPPEQLFKSVPPPTRLWLKVAGAALVVALVAAVGIERHKLRFVTAALAASPHGQLRVTSRQEAEVYVDGELRGMTPLTVDLPTGNHAVRLGSARMGRFRAAEVTIDDGVQSRLDVDLNE
ncbi:MAG TPA: serine/threonine-protein kinase [Myxococcales bacterium]